LAGKTTFIIFCVEGFPYKDKIEELFIVIVSFCVFPTRNICPQNLSYSLHEAGVVTTGGIDFIPLAEHLSILGTPVGKCRLWWLRATSAAAVAGSTHHFGPQT